MKFSNFLMASGLFATAVSAFQVPVASTQQRLAPLSMVATGFDTIDVTETAQRDVYSLQEWAVNCGAQTCEGFEITSQDGEDMSVITNQYIPSGSPVLYVPAEMVISSGDVEQEFGGNLEAAENAVIEIDGPQRLPLFRLMIKILSEYENGYNSPYLPWLNALPRRFYNGVAMTDACFECLPPYAAWLCMNERNNYSRFATAIRRGYIPLSESTTQDDAVMKWAYNVALTRFKEVWQPSRQKKIAPLADMFNHGSNPNVDITFDDQGNCMVNAIEDIQPGSQLTISLGNPSNPTPLFATYGFLSNDTPTIFCKAMHLQKEIEELNYDFKDLLFATHTGDIAPKVYDIFLYKLLENDPDNQNAFYVACYTDDEETKNAYHGQYFPYTLQALKEHVGSILNDVDQLTYKAQSYDLNTHPRVPVIVAHNNLVKDTFLRVQSQLDAMG